MFRKYNQWLQFVVVLIIASGFLHACSEPEALKVDPSLVNVTGMWNYQKQIFSSDTEQQEFLTSHFHVGLRDDGQSVTMFHCFNASDMVFMRSNEVLTNNNNQQLEIIDENTIQTVNVPDLWRLTKIKPEFDHFHNAGIVSLQSGTLPDIYVSQEVCVQRIVQEQSDKLHIKVSIPFQETYIDIELIVDDLNAFPYNVTQMTLTSPEFIDYYGEPVVNTLNGNVTATELSSDKVNLSFEITQVIFSTFPGDVIQGTINVNL